MVSKYNLFWTEEALRNLDEILIYLETNWTDRERKTFIIKLSKQVDLIYRNPNLFPVSEYNSRLRKAVLSKQTTIFYELDGFNINLIYLFNSKKDIKRIK
jgi:plasmid stabilization system protein ParE